MEYFPFEMCTPRLFCSMHPTNKSYKAGRFRRGDTPIKPTARKHHPSPLVDDSPKTVIRPTAEALSHADPTLFEMIRNIRHVLERHDPGEIGHNAALIYLAMFTAFRDAKLLELDSVPSLSLDIGDQEFEIVISHVSFDVGFSREAAEFWKKATSQGSDMMNIERDNDSPSSADKLLALGYQRSRNGQIPAEERLI